MPDLQILLLDIVVVCSVARALGWGFEKLHQPRVVGEMFAGILLGPSLLGWLAPSVFASLFPPGGLTLLYFLSQIGLLLFMFQVGVGLDLHEVRKMGHAVILTSNISVLVPLVAGSTLAIYLYPRLSSARVPLPVFALFMGTAMSITAFPVLARILEERNLLQSSVGMVAISCAAVDDVTAWCLLAGLIAWVHSGRGTSPWFTLAELIAYLVVMTWVVRPLLGRYSAFKKESSRETLAFAVLFLFLSAWTTERIGIHALFGAFFAGAILPRSESFSRNLASHLGTITSVLLFPLFFATTGLRTSVHLLSGGTLWFYCALIVLVAILGKLFGCAGAARASGMSWGNALSVGVLMNTRGLVELVILNVGLDLGVISPTLFSMMVIMALVTTFMTTPVLALLSRKVKVAVEPRPVSS
ncbi:MAG: cation:proton antiporter [Bradyrhizobium sp.]|nr:cation:proton antiporter [Terriglobales bacterium]